MYRKKEVYLMGRNLLVVVLVAIILLLFIPVTTQNYYIEKAFTSDNLIILDEDGKSVF
jgi:competence protein ComGC